MIDDLPPDIRALLDAEQAVAPGAAVRAAVRSKLALTIAKGGLAIAALKIFSVIVVVAAGTAGALRLADSGSDDRVEIPISRSTNRGVDRPLGAVEAASDRAAEPRVADGHRADAARDTTARRVETLVDKRNGARVDRGDADAARAVDARGANRGHHPPREQSPQLTEPALLGRAWRALADRDASRALALVDEARRRFPSGALVEERDVIHIRALAGVGRDTEAKHLAARFLAAHPTSIHRDLVQEAAP
jgi:hypothetical protein